MNATTSNTYLFGTNTQVDDLFKESYERIGIIGNELSNLQQQSAIMSANLALTSWTGKGLNLWLVQKMMFSLYPNQPIYTLPKNTVRVLDVVSTQPNRLNVGGTAFSTAGGSAANCFDPTQTTGCIQTVANGSIGYDYGSGNNNTILYVGITPLANSVYTLTVEYSFDNINWTTAYIAPSQSYPASQTTWFVIEHTINARSWRVTETGGATLAIQQIYFSQPPQNGVGDIYIGVLSRSEWMAIATKMNTATVPGYYFDALINPTLTLWPVPSVQMSAPTNILYTSYRYAQDVTQLFQTVEVPQRFYDALIADLSARLSLKFAPDRYQLLKLEAQNAYQLATQTDYENVPLRFAPNLERYGG